MAGWLGSHLFEEGADGFLVHGEVEVAGDEDEEVVGPGVLRDAGFCDDVSRAVAGGAHGDDEIRPSEARGDLAGQLEEASFVLGGQGDGLAICAGDDN